MSIFRVLNDEARMKDGLLPFAESERTWHLSPKMEDLSLKTILKKVNRKYEIPYLAGYSEDGKTIYIDKDMPEKFESKGKTFYTDQYLVLHEVVEKSLIDSYGLDYFTAHQIAYRAEMAAVEVDKINWKDYDDFMKKWVKKIDHFDRNSKENSFPYDLDLTPYVDEKDKQLITKLKKAKPA